MSKSSVKLRLGSLNTLNNELLRFCNVLGIKPEDGEKEVSGILEKLVALKGKTYSKDEFETEVRSKLLNKVQDFLNSIPIPADITKTADKEEFKEKKYEDLISIILDNVVQDLASPRKVETEVESGLSLGPTHTPLTQDLALWVVIRKGTEAISFEKYDEVITPFMCNQSLEGKNPEDIRGKAGIGSIIPFPRVDEYKLLKVATEIFLMANCAVKWKELPVKPLDDETKERFPDLESKIQGFWDEYLKEINGSRTIPYLDLIRRKLGGEFRSWKLKTNEEEKWECSGSLLRDKFIYPCFLELIWSYWHEEGMLEQAMNAISLRFQNKQRAARRDPLTHLNIDPLRPLNNLLWGYIQDEQHRLSLPRRAYEYNHEYGLTLYGKAVPSLQPADSRSKFIEAFHNLLHQCAIFFAAEDDTMVIADGFPVLSALKEVHLLLAQGAHNQYGDLPWTARMEMLMQEWILARPEMREFLGGRIMVPYPESWMDRVDTMKSLQGWTDVSIINFSVLAKYGERILLSIRFGSWSEVDGRIRAANWAIFWRDEIQAYIHNYRVVTGVDLTSEPVDTTMPSILLRDRLAEQLKELPRARQRRQLPAARRQAVPQINVPARAELFE